jgi:hypothetical protein
LEPFADDPLFEAEAGLGADLVQVAQRDVVRGRDRGRAEVEVGEVLAHVGAHTGEQRLVQDRTGVPVGMRGRDEQRAGQLDGGGAEGGRARVGTEAVGVPAQVGDVVGEQLVERAGAQVADGASDDVKGQAELLEPDLDATGSAVAGPGEFVGSRQVDRHQLAWRDQLPHGQLFVPAVGELLNRQSDHRLDILLGLFGGA